MNISLLQDVSIWTVARLSRLKHRYILFIIVVSIITVIEFLPVQRSETRLLVNLADLSEKPTHHPIDALREQANLEWKNLLNQRTYDVGSAAKAYRLRRGRHPPPGFEAWYRFAQTHNAVMVEEFFDQIYTDLNPFWGVPAEQIRHQAETFDHVISVRNGSTTWKSDTNGPWMLLWHDMIQTIASYLPDVDLAINVMDESRVLVPWEKIDEYMRAEIASRRVLAPSDVLSSYTGLPSLAREPGGRSEPKWHGGRYWEFARRGCHPDSPARKMEPTYDFSGPPPLPSGYPEHSYRGYVANWTLAKDPCIQPNLQQYHGTFIEPISTSTTSELLPIFGGSKLSVNNEILLPPAMYWTKDKRYSGGNSHGGLWKYKQDRLIWRGSATGGRNRRENWTHFHRHRFLSMVNGTSVRLSETTSSASEGPPNFELPSYQFYNLKALRLGVLGDWISTFSNAAFTHLSCFPEEDVTCSYTNHYYKVKSHMPMHKQYAAKYLPDLDGNSFSGRYRSFLLSTSLPIKATIYNEWHDSRLVPWLHFVPMDNSFIDIYGIMDYFLGYNGYDSHDDAAHRIAHGGKSWAEIVLRREDMQIYVYRLLLEFARLCDDQRERLGYVDDLFESS